MTAQDPGHPRSAYAASVPEVRPRPTLKGAHKADICVIGAGYTGLAAALRAAQRGLSVIVLEARRTGWGASGRNGGQVIAGQRQDQTTLEQRLGPDQARALWDLGLEALSGLRGLMAQHAIDADWRDGHLTAAWKPAHAQDLEAYSDHLRARYGYDGARYVAKADMQAHVAAPLYHGGLLDTHSGHVHPLKLVQGLAAAAEAKGVRIYEDTRVLEIVKEPAPTVRASAGAVDAQFAVLACNGYLEGLEPQLEPYILPIHNYIVATEPLGEARAKALIPCGAAVADTKFVLDYYRISADGRLIFGGGETYGRSEPADVKAFVRPYLERVFPQLRGVGLDYGWGGTLAITLPRWPHVGRIGTKIYFAQGYSGQGVAIATQMGGLIADAIAGQAAQFDVYGALPVPRLPGGTLLRRPLQAAAMLWYGLRDRL